MSDFEIITCEFRVRRIECITGPYDNKDKIFTTHQLFAFTISKIVSQLSYFPLKRIAFVKFGSVVRIARSYRECYTSVVFFK